jgi:hypothetical protein
VPVMSSRHNGFVAICAVVLWCALVASAGADAGSATFADVTIQSPADPAATSSDSGARGSDSASTGPNPSATASDSASTDSNAPPVGSESATTEYPAAGSSDPASTSSNAPATGSAPATASDPAASSTDPDPAAPPGTGSNPAVTTSDPAAGTSEPAAGTSDPASTAAGQATTSSGAAAAGSNPDSTASNSAPTSADPAASVSDPLATALDSAAEAADAAPTAAAPGDRAPGEAGPPALSSDAALPGPPAPVLAAGVERLFAGAGPASGSPLAVPGGWSAVSASWVGERLGQAAQRSTLRTSGAATPRPRQDGSGSLPGPPAGGGVAGASTGATAASGHSGSASGGLSMILVAELGLATWVLFKLLFVAAGWRSVTFALLLERPG